MRFPQFHYSVASFVILGGLYPFIFRGTLGIGLLTTAFLLTILVTEIPVFACNLVKTIIANIQTTIDGRDCIPGINSATKDTIEGANLLQFMIPIPFFQKNTVIKLQNTGPTKSPTKGIIVAISATKANSSKTILFNVLS